MKRWCFRRKPGRGKRPLMSSGQQSFNSEDRSQNWGYTLRREKDLSSGLLRGRSRETSRPLTPHPKYTRYRRSESTRERHLVQGMWMWCRRFREEFRPIFWGMCQSSYSWIHREFPLNDNPSIFKQIFWCYHFKCNILSRIITIWTFKMLTYSMIPPDCKATCLPGRKCWWRS